MRTGALLQEGTQHPGVLFVDFHAGGEHVGGRIIVQFVRDPDARTQGADQGFVAVHQLADHVLGRQHFRLFLDAGQFGIALVGGRGEVAQGADALGDLVQRIPLLGVLLLEHHVQGREHRSGDVPVEVVGLQVQHVGVREDGGQRFDDLGTVFGADSGIHVHCVSPQVNGRVCVEMTTLSKKHQLSTDKENAYFECPGSRVGQANICGLIARQYLQSMYSGYQLIKDMHEAILHHGCAAGHGCARVCPGRGNGRGARRDRRGAGQQHQGSGPAPLQPYGARPRYLGGEAGLGAECQPALRTADGGRQDRRTGRPATAHRRRQGGYSAADRRRKHLRAAAQPGSPGRQG
ncbi:hypothetical protein MASSI9I_90384 [Massilia sp. 9I]|nr:hypothetical protein MASSI9I_90384 [Massilia sp. 9I]